MYDENKQVNGVLIATISTLFVNQLQDVKINDEGKVIVLDRVGKVMYHSENADLAGKPLESGEYKSLVDLAPNDQLQQGEVSTDEKVVFYSKIPQSDWTIIVEDSYVDVNQPLTSMANKMYIVLFSSIAFSVIVGILLSRVMTRPVTSITALFKKLAGET